MIMPTQPWVVKARDPFSTLLTSVLIIALKPLTQRLFLSCPRATAGASRLAPRDPEAAIAGFANEWLLRVLCLSRVSIPKPVSTFRKPCLARDDAIHLAVTGLNQEQNRHPLDEISYPTETYPDGCISNLTPAGP
jgi:hypothetical protein